MMPRHLRRIALIMTMAVCVSSLPFLLVGELPGERWLSANDDHAMRFALVGAALLAADVVLPIPSSVVGTMLGARLGLGAGFVAVFVGLMTGQSTAYFVSRGLLRKRSVALPAAPLLAVVFMSRPVPVLAEAVVLSAGAARMSWPQFMLACGSGNLIYAGVLAFIGSQWVPGALIGPGLLLPMLLPAAAWLIWRRTRRVNNREG
jgi:uncharacterized membrane protein YdjX (TVP38/TMEM64 family)